MSSSVVSERMVLAARGARGRRALIWGGVTLVRTRDSKLPLALTAKYLWSASAWVRKPAPAMASSISVWVRELRKFVNSGWLASHRHFNLGRVAKTVFWLPKSS